MDYTFVAQLIISSIVGGIFVTVQTLIAEKSPQKIAGIALSIPSTLAVALFFVGLTTSPESVEKIVPVIPISFGITLIFCTVYVYLANYVVLSKIRAIFLTSFVALSVWLLLALQLRYVNTNNLFFSLIFYFCIVTVTHYFLAIRQKLKTSPISVVYTAKQKIIRSIIGGCIVGMVVFLTKVLGPFWGGVFSTFPAVYFSTLLIIHWQHGKQFLFHIAKTLPLASPIFIVYAIAVQYTYPRIGIYVGSIVAFGICLLYPISLRYILKKNKL